MQRFPDPYVGHTAKHQALLYASEDDFVGALAPFVTEGVEAGHSVLVVTSSANLRALRGAVGGPPGVRFVDARDWYVKPAATLGSYFSFIQDQLARGWPAVRVIGEVVWPERDDGFRREWARYEAALNAVFEPLPTWVVCPYNSERLPASVVEGARATHPGVIEAGVASASAGYVSAERLLVDSPRDMSIPAGQEAHRFEAADFVAAGNFIEGEARRAGLDHEEVQNLVAAASEIALNAFVHAKSGVLVAAWREDGDFVCQIEDEGSGPGDPLAGYGPPGGTRNGWGLWLARQRSDLLEVGRGAHGAAVRLTMRRAAAAPARFRTFSTRL